MAIYVCELGIDWNAVQNPSTTYYYMPCGFYGGYPQSVEFERPVVTINDSIDFNIFDITSSQIFPSLQNPNVVLTISAQSADSNAGPYTGPFETVATKLPYWNSIPTQYFTTVGTSLPCFSLATTDTFAVQNIIDLDGKVFPQTAINFQVTFTVTVISANHRTRNYVHDPEMVVGPGT